MSAFSTTDEGPVKLLYCPACADCVTLLQDVERSCFCGACRGRYVGIEKAVVSGADVQVIGIDNLQFEPIVRRALVAKPGTPADDYDLKSNTFRAWMFGPNALQVTKETAQTNRDRREVEADKTLKYKQYVDILATFLRKLPAHERDPFIAEALTEVQRLARLPLALPSKEK